MVRHLVHVSGGKDSTALYLRALEHQALRPHFQFQAVFADTGHEHELTYEYVRELPGRTGGPAIRWVKADLSGKFAKHREHIRAKWPEAGVPAEVVDRALAVNQPTGNPFLDACILQAGFPAPRGRFCTRMLKINPTQQQVLKPIWDAGDRVISWRGIRADESPVRSTLPRVQTLVAPGPQKGYHPLLHWTVEDVWRMHQKHGIKPNDLYRRGFTRVGCFPCIMSNKGELRVLAERYPEAVDKLRKWESIVGQASKHSTPQATFFQVRQHDRRATTLAQIDNTKHGIDAAVAWAKTTRGGKQFDLIPLDDIRAEFGTACDEWGICE